MEFLVIKNGTFYLKPKLIERCRVVLNFSHRSTRTRKLVSAEILRFEFWPRAEIWIYKFKIAWKKIWFLNIQENDFILRNESTVQQKSLLELLFSTCECHLFILGSPARAIVEGDDVDSYENESSEFSMLPLRKISTSVTFGQSFGQILQRKKIQKYIRYCNKKFSKNIDFEGWNR